MKLINKCLLSFWFATKIINLTSLELALYFTYYHHHYSKIFLYLFFFSSSSDTHHLHGCHAVGINSLYVSFLSEFQLKSLMLVFNLLGDFYLICDYIAIFFLFLLHGDFDIFRVLFFSLSLFSLYLADELLDIFIYIRKRFIIQINSFHKDGSAKTSKV